MGNLNKFYGVGNSEFRLTSFIRRQVMNLLIGQTITLSPPPGKKIKLLSLSTNADVGNETTISTPKGNVVTGQLVSFGKRGSAGRFIVGQASNYLAPNTTLDPSDIGEYESGVCPPILSDQSISITGGINNIQIFFSYAYGD